MRANKIEPNRDKKKKIKLHTFAIFFHTICHLYARARISYIHLDDSTKTLYDEFEYLKQRERKKKLSCKTNLFFNLNF